MGVLCALGIHDWNVRDVGVFEIRMRECRRCDKLQQQIGLAPWRTLP